MPQRRLTTGAGATASTVTAASRAGGSHRARHDDGSSTALHEGRDGASCLETSLDLLDAVNATALAGLFEANIGSG